MIVDQSTSYQVLYTETETVHSSIYEMWIKINYLNVKISSKSKNTEIEKTDSKTNVYI